MQYIYRYIYQLNVLHICYLIDLVAFCYFVANSFLDFTIHKVVISVSLFLVFVSLYCILRV